VRSSRPTCLYRRWQSLAPCSRFQTLVAPVHTASNLFRRVFGWAKPSPPAANAGQRDYTLWHLPEREALWLRHAESPTLAGAALPSHERAATDTSHCRSSDPVKAAVCKEAAVRKHSLCWLLKSSKTTAPLREVSDVVYTLSLADRLRYVSAVVPLPGFVTDGIGANGGRRTPLDASIVWPVQSMQVRRRSRHSRRALAA